MASRNRQFLLFDALPFLGPLPLDLLRRRRIRVMDTAGRIGTNLDDLSALAAVHDDGLGDFCVVLSRMVMLVYSAQRMIFRRRSSLARPYRLRLMALTLQTLPSTAPEL